MPDLSDARPTLTTEEATRLVEFARACKAAARAVLLYPAGHPAIAATLGRIVQITSPAALTEMPAKPNGMAPASSEPLLPSSEERSRLAPKPEALPNTT